MRFFAAFSAAVAAVAAACMAQPAMASKQDSVYKSLRVTGVEGKLGLYNSVTVEVESLSAFLGLPSVAADSFVLYLDWRPMRGIVSRALDDSGKLIFDLRRTEESKTAWDALLGRPISNQRGKLRRHYYAPKDSAFIPDLVTGISVSVGYKAEKSVPTGVHKYNLVLINGTWLLVFLLCFAGLLYLLWHLAKYTNILRDSCPELPIRQRPFSLGHSQMAFWLVIVATAYIFILLTTGERDSIPGSILVLLGISAVTAFSSKRVEAGKQASATTKRKAFEIEKGILEAALKFLRERTSGTTPPQNLEAMVKEEGEKKVRMGQVEDGLAAMQTVTTPQASEGFWKDILSENDGIDLHRFQILIWTLVMGVTFAVSIYNTLAMPVFNETMLALMGISNGTYVGFKFPEKQA